MNAKNKAGLIAIFFLLLGFSRANAEPGFSVTDLGTLGGNASTANGVAGRGGSNTFGMIVGSSTTNDNSPHAFLYTENQMFDLNTLCDLSQSDFKVLTAATSISDSCLIIGEGITNNGDKHAFVLTPLQVEGGQWSYNCCQWIWIQEIEGWWWEEGCGCYKWHGPPGPHRPCPPQPPPCWRYPLPCPPHCRRPRPTPTPTQPPGRTPPSTNQTPTPSRGGHGRNTPTPPPDQNQPPPPYTGTPLLSEPAPTPRFHGGRGHGHNSRSTPAPGQTFTTHTLKAEGTPTPSTHHGGGGGQTHTIKTTETRHTGKPKSTPKATPEIPR